MSNEIINPYSLYRDAVGTPLDAGSLTFYVNESSTLTTVYSDEDLTIAQANPYTLDSAGRVTGDIRFTGKKRVIVKDKHGAVIRTLDNVTSSPDGLNFIGPDPDLTDTDAAIIIGTDEPATNNHVAIGPTTIYSKATTTTANNLKINPLGGGLQVGGTGVDGVLILGDAINGIGDTLHLSGTVSNSAASLNLDTEFQLHNGTALVAQSNTNDQFEAVNSLRNSGTMETVLTLSDRFLIVPTEVDTLGTYTIDSTDIGTDIEFTNGDVYTTGGFVITLSDATGWTSGDVVVIFNNTDGDITFSTGANVDIIGGGAATNAQTIPSTFAACIKYRRLDGSTEIFQYVGP